MKVKEESFWKFVVACLRTGNKELAKKLFKQNKDYVMKQYIDKSALVAEIERRISVLKANESVISMLAGGMFVNEFKDLLSFLDTLEVKEVDLDFQTFAKEMETVFALPSSKTENTEEEPLNWEYTIAKYFFELGLKAKGEVYVVTRSEEHSDYVEAVFLSKDKAEEYCKPYNEDENRYARNITQIEIQ